MKLILASSSPRRRELLSQIGVSFDVMSADIDETPLASEPASEYVVRMAREKVMACTSSLEGLQTVTILGADTSVIVDGDILGKPDNYESAKEMLLKLSGREHQVMTSICVVTCSLGRTPESADLMTRLVTTDVKFRPLSEGQIQSYWNSGEPQDKAGAYGIQGFGAVFVDSIKGSYSAVVGLPLAETAELLSTAGVAIWQQY
ncbi:Maf family protein [Alkalimarinus sediminis]|nr:Maf family protein [Alkalimarinus sediminis]